MKGPLALAAVLTAAWLAVSGLVGLILRYAVVEVLCVELAAVVLAVIARVLLILERTPVAAEPAQRCGRCEEDFQRALAHLDTA